MLSRRRFGLLASAAIGSHAVAASAQSRRKVKLGGLATLDGPLAELGKDGFRGLELALAELGSGTEGVEIELSRGSSDSKPDVALAAARRLIEQNKVDILIGPLSGSEGIRIKDYAKTVPRVTAHS
jgi:branched-chain amino acid transport system substrate-binding protein